MSNNDNNEYVPDQNDEMNYEVYNTKFNELYVPSRELPKIESEGLVIFKYEAPKADEDGYVKLPQVPYEIKECALKGFLYTFFLTLAGRMASGLHYILAASSTTIFPFVPATVFLYQYLKPLWWMYNVVDEVRLLPSGKDIKLIYRYQNPKIVRISNLIKKREETFLNQCFTEPFLFPVQMNQSEEYGKFSLRSHRMFYLYADTHKSIKNGEILRAVLCNQPIKLD